MAGLGLEPRMLDSQLVTFHTAFLGGVFFFFYTIFNIYLAVLGLLFMCAGFL